MLLRQIEYFQAIVRCGSFTEAAEECHISQSAISQQMQQLEAELGFSLMNRKSRHFSLTEAGHHFYQETLHLTDQLARICRESRKIAAGDRAVLRLAWLKNYGGSEFMLAVSAFSRAYPSVDVQIRAGTHEEIFTWLQEDAVDLAMSDQRRAFSDSYHNLILAEVPCRIEVPAGSPLSQCGCVEMDDLAGETCILVTTPDQEENDIAYWRQILGFRGRFVSAVNLEEAKMMVLAGKGFLPMEGSSTGSALSGVMACVPLCRNGSRLTRRYCAYWKQDNSGYYVESFSEMLQERFAAEKGQKPVRE